MSNALFPSLPGLTWDMTITPSFSTIIQKSSTRQEARLAQDIWPLYSFELVYEFLRDDGRVVKYSAKNPNRYTELAQILGFYNSRQGSFDSFLLDPCLVTGKTGQDISQGLQIGVGDGSTTSFQLLWNFGGFTDEVQAVKGTPVVYANGAIVPAAGNWTFTPRGVVTFATAPAAGIKITADCHWYWRVRFEEDTLEIKAMMFNLYECQSLKLVQVRDE